MAKGNWETRTFYARLKSSLRYQTSLLSKIKTAPLQSSEPRVWTKDHEWYPSHFNLDRVNSQLSHLLSLHVLHHQSLQISLLLYSILWNFIIFYGDSPRSSPARTNSLQQTLLQHPSFKGNRFIYAPTEKFTILTYKVFDLIENRFRLSIHRLTTSPSWELRNCEFFFSRFGCWPVLVIRWLICLL